MLHKVILLMKFLFGTHTFFFLTDEQTPLIVHILIRLNYFDSVIEK